MDNITRAKMRVHGVRMVAALAIAAAVCPACRSGRMPEPALRPAEGPGVGGGPPPAAASAFAAHAELGRLGRRFPVSVWPGFRPDTMPFVYWFESGLLLVNPPSPLPQGFAPLAGPVPAAWRRFAPGVDPLEGIDPPTVTSNALGPDTASVYAVAAHEAFHTFVFGRAVAGRRFGRGEDNNVAPDYPLFDADNETDFAVEARLLRAALAAADRESRLRLTRRFLAVRQARQSRMGAEIVGYEVAAELNEGLAHYVELRSLSAGSADPSFRWPGAAAAARRRLMIRLEILTRQEQGGARVRFYRTGAAMGLLLDRLGDSSWKERLEREDVSLQDALGAAVAYRDDDALTLVREAFDAAGRDTVAAAVAAYASGLRARRQRLADSALAGDGLLVQLDASAIAGSELRLCSYDPNRVFQTATGVVLHLSRVRLCSQDLYDASFTTPVLQSRRPGLARSVIGSPDAVRLSAAGTLAGLADGSRLVGASDVRIAAPGFELRARRADVARVGRVLTIRLLP